MFIAPGAVLSWGAVILQLYLIIINRVTTVPETIIRFFSFYTILTNILVAFHFSLRWLKPNSRAGKFISREKVTTAITVYITVVGATYNMILRQLWSPQGLQLVVDELLHSVIPVLFIIYWFVCVPKGKLAWKDVLSWLSYPLVYFVFIVLRGGLSGFYPYPFLDVVKLGYNKVVLNSAIFCGVFLVLGALFVLCDKLIKYNPRGHRNTD